MDIFGSLVTAADLAQRIIVYTKEVQGGKEERLSLFAEVHALHTLLPILRSHIKNVQDDETTWAEVQVALAQPLAQCQDALIYVEMKLRLSERSLGQRLLWPFQKKDIADRMGQIERLKVYVTLGLQNGLLAMAKSIRNDLASVGSDVLQLLEQQKVDQIRAAEILSVVKTIRTEVQDDGIRISSLLHDGKASVDERETQYRQKLAHWISPISFQEQQDLAFSTRTAGTNAWIFSSPPFLSWLSDPETRILWCPGQPGVGKTILTSVVINDLENRYSGRNDVAVVFAYCSYKIDLTVIQVVQSLVRQLIFWRESLSGALAPLKSYMSKSRRPDLTAMMTIMRAELETFTNVFIVVDAMDEFPEQDRAELLHQLSQLCSVTSAKLMVTSRHILTIESDLCPDLKLEIIARDEDIAAYSRDRVSRPGTLKRLVQKPPSLEDTVVSKVLLKAQGMFLLAKLHLDALATKSNRSSILKALDTLPDSFGATYQDALNRIDVQAISQRNIAYNVLSWVSMAIEPLSLPELQCALAVQPGMTDLTEDDLDDPELILTACLGLVWVNEDTQIVSLVHYTLQEFIQGVCRNHQSFMTPTQLSTICIHYLFLDFPPTPRDTFDLREQYPFLRYAIENWALQSGGVEDPDLQGLMLELLGNEAKVKFITENLFMKTGTPFTLQAIHLCANFGLVHVAQRLLQLGADPCALDSERKTPLHYASVAKMHAEDMVKLFLSFEQVNLDTEDIKGNTPFMRAASAGRCGVLTILAPCVEVDHCDNLNRTALRLATGNGHVAAVKLLARLDGVDVNARDRFGRTPLLTAAMYGDNDAVDALLEVKGVDVGARCIRNRNALTYAAMGGHAGIAKTLLAAGSIDVNMLDSNHRTPLHLAAERGHMAILTLLLATGQCDINHRDSKGVSALTYAAGYGLANVVKALLATGTVNVNSRDDDGATALSYAASTGQVAVLEMLLATGQIDMAASDEWFRALDWAIDGGYEEAVKVLLAARKLDIRETNAQGLTLLSLAEERRETVIAALLIDAAAGHCEPSETVFPQVPITKPQSLEQPIAAS